MNNPEPKTILLIHGHDEARHEVARLLERSTPEAQVVILGEQASRNQTVIEQFEDVGSTASFAVVLLTPDDLGKAKNAAELSPRAHPGRVVRRRPAERIIS